MLNIPLNLTTQGASDVTAYHLDTENKKFPLLLVGKNSYINRANLITHIDQETLDTTNPVHNIHIGRYVSIAYDVTFLVGRNHDYLAVTTHPIGGGVKPKYPIVKGQILIQNDVWIGNGATIMPGVTLHNGSVVAANSHVVKDAPPYSIVGGNPAKVVKYRFSEDIIKKLLKIKWWNWSDKQLEENAELINSHNVEEFCNKFYKGKNVNIPLNAEKFYPMPEKRAFLYFVDYNVDYSLWKWVITVFSDLHCSKGTDALILAAESDDAFSEVKKYIADNCSEKYKHLFCVLKYSHEDEEALIKNADFYIANRDFRTIMRSETAYEYGVGVLSAVDACGF